MFTFKCVACGADLPEFKEDKSVCLHCGTDNFLDIEGKKALRECSSEELVQKKAHFLSFPQFIKDKLPEELALDWYTFRDYAFHPRTEVCEVIMKKTLPLPGFLGFFSGSALRSTEKVAVLDLLKGKVIMKKSQYSEFFADLVKEYLRYCGKKIKVIEHVLVEA